LAEELVTKLTDIGGFQVVERRFLNKILQEQKWSLTDLVNPKTAVQFGQISGVQALITGQVIQ
jgi:curli biogenesis system outer membrane secretion channel CsgG